MAEDSKPGTASRNTQSTNRVEGDRRNAMPSISLPKGGGALRSIEEKFTVNAANGTCEFTVPLPFSRTRSGLDSSLALHYNSGSGNNAFGLGWSIAPEELKLIVHNFASLLNPMIETIDRHGLKRRFLNKHLKSVDRFYKDLSLRENCSECALQLKRRFEKNRDKLFTFLRHNSMHWNNNNVNTQSKRMQGHE